MTCCNAARSSRGKIRPYIPSGVGSRAGMKAGRSLGARICWQSSAADTQCRLNNGLQRTHGPHACKSSTCTTESTQIGAYTCSSVRAAATQFDSADATANLLYKVSPARPGSHSMVEPACSVPGGVLHCCSRFTHYCQSMKAWYPPPTFLDRSPEYWELLEAVQRPRGYDTLVWKHSCRF